MSFSGNWLDWINYFKWILISNWQNHSIVQVHRDDFTLNVKLQLFALTAKQPAFHQLRSVEQLGYITALRQRYPEFLPKFCPQYGFFSRPYHFFQCRNDSGIRGVQFSIQSTVKVFSISFVFLFLSCSLVLLHISLTW